MSDSKNKTLVIGASVKSQRYSNIATKRLKSYDHEVIALGLREGDIEDTKIITDRSLVTDIDTATLYIGPRHQPDYYDFIIGLDPRRVIFNPGTENPTFYEMLEHKGIEVVIACTLVMLATGDY